MKRSTDAPAVGRRTHLLILAAAAVLSHGCEGTPTDNGGRPVVALSAAAASFLGTEGGTDPDAQVVNVTSDGPGAVVGLAASVAYGAGEPDGWLAAALSGTTAPATLTLEPAVADVPAGSYAATVTVSGSGTDPKTLAVTLVLGESAPPTIVITSPTRAAMLQEGTLDPSDVHVTGEVCHDSVPITALVVLGQDLPVSGDDLCEAFDVVQSSPWGLSTVTVRAENAFGRSAEVVQSYLRSPTYFPAALTANAGARVEHGVLAHLNQPAVDDGIRGTPAEPDADDLATLVWVSAAQLDLNAEIANPLVRNPSNAGSPTFWDCIFPIPDRTNPALGIQITHGTIQWSAPSVDYVRTVNGGLSAGVTMRDVTVPLAVHGWFDGACVLPNLSLTVTGSMSLSRASVDATWLVSLSPYGGAQVTAQNVFVTLSGLQVDVDWGGFDFLGLGLLDDAANDLIDAFKSDLSAALADAIGNQSAAVVDDFLESFSLEQPEELNGSGTVGAAELDRMVAVGPTGSGYLQLGLATQSWPDGTPTGPDTSFGSIRADGAIPSFGSGYEVGFAVKDDLINQFFWAAWQAGALEVPDVSVYTGEAYPGLEGSVSALLPPVVVPSASGHMLDVGVGDLAVSLTVDRAVFGLPGFLTGDPVTVEAHGSGVVGLDLELDDATYRLHVTDLASTLDVQVDTDAGLDREALTDAVEQALTDLLEKLVPEALAAVTLPQIDSRDLPGLPADETVRVGNATLDRAGRYLRITGSVVDSN